MKSILKILLFISGLIIMEYSMKGKTQLPDTAKRNPVLVIHGGAGTILKKNMTEQKEKEYKDKLQSILIEGMKLLKAGKTSIDVVEHVICIMENSPLFNAGKGSVFNNEGKQAMDASLMDGRTLNAGAVADVSNIKNPIVAARKVMDNSIHVLLTGKGAEKFAEEEHLELEQPEYFFNEKRYNQLQEAQKRKKILLDHDSDKDRGNQGSLWSYDSEKYGTVGAVALDVNGNLAAGTSTGGMTNKKYGRIGDSPIIGAGTYANNKTCAVSCTGHGEFFLRSVVAYDVSAIMEYQNKSLKYAADFVINTKLKNIEGSGGLIAVDSKGNVAMPFNTKGMYRAVIYHDGNLEVKIYAD